MFYLVEDTEKTTVPVTTNRQTASRATEPTGKPGTTGTLPILTTTGSVVPENLSGTTYLQTTTSTAAAATTQSQPKIFQVRHGRSQVVFTLIYDRNYSLRLLTDTYLFIF